LRAIDTAVTSCIAVENQANYETLLKAISAWMTNKGGESARLDKVKDLVTFVRRRPLGEAAYNEVHFRPLYNKMIQDMPSFLRHTPIRLSGWPVEGACRPFFSVADDGLPSFHRRPQAYRLRLIV
jgi:hypothetical protein